MNVSDQISQRGVGLSTEDQNTLSPGSLSPQEVCDSACLETWWEEQHFILTKTELWWERRLHYLLGGKKTICL